MNIGLAAASTVPAILVKAGVLGFRVEIDTVLYGVAILGAAFLLSWGAEVAQLDISQALAIAFLAFIAVLPEYAVDLVFAWKAGSQDFAAGALGHLCGEQQCRQLAIANMTGSNRLLIGLGWSAVVLTWWLKTRQRSLQLGTIRRTEIGFLLLATLWAFTIPMRRYLSLLDLGVLGALFVAYIWRLAMQEAEEPELVGPPVAVAALPVAARRAATLAMFVFAAAVILAAAEPFADGLVRTGEKFGIDSFLLVQWLAPLASEAPEMIIAILFVLRMRPGAGMGTLISSKVNQWTLLIATLPLVYSIANHSATHALHLGSRQVEEVFLTAAQSAFAIAVLANLRISRAEATLLLVLFGAQFRFESTVVRYGFATAYLALCAAILIASRENRRGLWLALRDAVQRPWRAVAGTTHGESRG
ncbi:MAG: sodium:calcium antiporter [Acidobacteria bacterium]|nr:sodium:calcium antiporter [Acidobacteriota bacterium]